MQTGDQIESQTESFAPMTVAFAQDAENLQSANHVFNFDPLRSQFSIQLLFFFRQLMQFAVFQRQNHFRRFALQLRRSSFSGHETLAPLFSFTFQLFFKLQWALITQTRM